jgi:hypothetical protein
MASASRSASFFTTPRSSPPRIRCRRDPGNGTGDGIEIVDLDADVIEGPSVGEGVGRVDDVVARREYANALARMN